MLPPLFLLSASPLGQVDGHIAGLRPVWGYVTPTSPRCLGWLWPGLVPAELGPWLPLALCPEALQPSFIMAWRCLSVAVLVTLWAGQFFAAWESLDIVGHSSLSFPRAVCRWCPPSGCRGPPLIRIMARGESTGVAAAGQGEVTPQSHRTQTQEAHGSEAPAMCLGQISQPL